MVHSSRNTNSLRTTPRQALIGCFFQGAFCTINLSCGVFLLYFGDAEQVGSGWLNPTEEAIWPLAETLDVAQLAFEGLNTHIHAHTEGHAKDDGECTDYCRLKA